MKTFLVGMPGSGKSYWGQQVAALYRLPFTDLDALITDGENMGIPQIFEKYGEDGFRERERKYLQQIIETAGENAVIACGGGTPCFYDNMQLMKNAGTVIYLEADPDYLYGNMLQSIESRPLLERSSPIMEQLEKMLSNRKPFYEQAHHILQAKDITLATFDKIINHV